MLLVVGLGVGVSAPARVACFVPVAVGMAAVGGLTHARMGPEPRLDDLILAATIAALGLVVLLVQSATATRLWRLWAALVFAGALLAAAAFAR